MSANGILEPQTVLGINFGGSFSSVAILNKEGLADCIANEDGERQIANAVSFNGEEEYVGIPARSQLVRNSKNTIIGFRGLLGKKFAEISNWVAPHGAAPLVEKNGAPAFKVTAAEKEVTISSQEIITKFIRTLLASAEDYLGRKVDSAVFAVPSGISQAESEALIHVADLAGVQTLQLVPTATAAAVAYGFTTPGAPDRTLLVLDVGASSTTATVLAVRSGLLTTLASAHNSQVGGDQVDTKLVEFFSKEFTKKTKIPLESSNTRAQMKLLLACEVTKRSLSASTTAAISVESLAYGIDFSTTINRSRLDLLAATVFASIEAVATKAVESAEMDPVQIQEVLLIGGSGKLPSLTSRLAYVFPCPITSRIDPDEVVAKGCALQAQVLSQTLYDEKPHFSSLDAATLVRPIGLVTSNGVFTCLLDSATPLPARRVVDITVTTPTQGGCKALISLWEGTHRVEVHQSQTRQTNGQANGTGDEADDEDDEDEEEIKKPSIKPERQLAQVAIVPSKSIRVTVNIDVGCNGVLEVRGTGDEVIAVKFGR